ncbi:MAG: hypothetical protein HC942_24770 [Microcoleus sp. SU_5_6]|nr:hypothetical protein [Microcoleus sp. SU_5_6]
MVDRRDYTAEAVAAAKSVLLELTRILGEYRNEIVVIGGWVPDLLLSSNNPHSADVTDITSILIDRSPIKF